jgi:hypothetical protein
MTDRRIAIDKLELHVSAGALRGADRSARALDALGREVAHQIGERLSAAALEGADAIRRDARRIEVRVPAGALNAGRIAEAVDLRVRRGPSVTGRGAR